MRVIKIHISKPVFSEKLAEFVGIMLGDGSISKSGYTIQITLNKIYEKDFLNYIYKMVFNLFTIKPKIFEIKNKETMFLRINSLELFYYLKDMGLSTGNEEKYIPRWILQEKSLIRSCIRGLFDTDGSIFLSSRWCVLNFTNSSKMIFNEFRKNMKKIGIPTIASRNHINATSLWKIKKFLKEIGSSNIKHVIKFLEYVNNKNTVRSDESILPLFSKYKNTKLPFYYKGPVV